MPWCQLTKTGPFWCSQIPWGDTLPSSSANQSGSPSIQVDVFYAIFYQRVIIVITIMNLASIVAFWSLPSLREKPSELLILNLSCADLLTGMVLLPYGCLQYITHEYEPTGETGCIEGIAFLVFSIHGSLFALTMLTTIYTHLQFSVGVHGIPSVYQQGHTSKGLQW